MKSPANINFELQKTPLSKAKGDILVVGIFKGEDAGKILKTLDSKIPVAFQEEVKRHLESVGFKSRLTDVVSIPTFAHVECARMIIVGLGAKEEFTANALRKALGNVARKVKTKGKTTRLVVLIRKPERNLARPGTDEKSSRGASGDDALVKAIVEGWILGKFDFDKYKSPKGKIEETRPAQSKKESVNLVFLGLTMAPRRFEKAVTEAKAIAFANNFARSLIAEPPAYMTPTRLSIEAKGIARENGLTCEILNVNQIEKLGMGCFLGVARGADEPAKLIVVKYTNPRARRIIAIVGKGITFDSGGLSLKPAQSMERMKYDMSGAACVLAVMKVVGELKPNVSVMAVVAATENMPSGKALHPGDVLTSMNGKTVEVNNTDAEGRLILADALTYALRHKADQIIDVATLTGAVVQALGRAAAGIMGNNQDLIDRLIKAGQSEGEKFWQLPLFDEYKSTLESDVADLINAGSRGEAGSSCAGMFLSEFVDGKPWAHLDIAGVAWSEKSKDEINKGGTGFGVRTLAAYLMSQNRAR